jgi:L-methionine (R)-S-oxide reductase
MSGAAKSKRNYEAAERALRSAMVSGSGREDRMRAATEVLWEHLKETDVSWLGFYRIAESGDAMTLCVCRPKPACSPIGLNGVCGRAWREKTSQVVEDVHALGEGHIVCDPKNLSEVVVPCLEPDGSCWGVLDLDSFQFDAFSADDARALREILVMAGLSV